jgi:sec-independent protein translocase protein TatA
MPNIGPLEIVIVLVIVLIIFGPKRLPDLGRSLGRGMREFKDSVTGKDKDELPAAGETTERPDEVPSEPVEQVRREPTEQKS